MSLGLAAAYSACMAQPGKQSPPKPADRPELSESFGLSALGGPAENSGLALDQLSAALANLLGAGNDPYSPASEPNEAELDPSLGDIPERAEEELVDNCEITPQSILEAMLFVGSPNNEPLSSKQVAALMRGVRPAEIDAAVAELNASYDRRRCPYQIVAEGEGYRLRLRPQFSRLRDKFHGKARLARLSQAAIEVLAAVAYQGPLSTEEINKQRGTPSGHIVTQLVRRQLLRLERSTTVEKRIEYHTTPRFLELFGLKALQDLPRSDDFEAR